MERSTGVTALLLRWRSGSPEALEELIPLVYAELRRLAGRQLRGERPDHALQATALVHDAFLRLVDHHEVDWKNRAHFFGVAARLMRQILVDRARARGAQKRSAELVPLGEEEDGVPAAQVGDGRLLELDDALRRLGEIDERQHRIVELRYFGGLTSEETAEVLGTSLATVKREWTTARAWLRREVARGLGP